MIVSLLRILTIIVVIVVAAMIETTVATPFVVLAIFLVQSRSLAPGLFFVFVSSVSLFLASVMMQSWLLIFLVLVIGGIILRSDIVRLQTSFIKSWMLVVIMGGIISFFATPVISTSYVFHSLVSVFIAAVICHKAFSIKEKKLRWKEIRFGGGE